MIVPTVYVHLIGYSIDYWPSLLLCMIIISKAFGYSRFSFWPFHDILVVPFTSVAPKRSNTKSFHREVGVKSVCLYMGKNEQRKRRMKFARMTLHFRGNRVRKFAVRDQHEAPLINTRLSRANFRDQSSWKRSFPRKNFLPCLPPIFSCAFIRSPAV